MKKSSKIEIVYQVLDERTRKRVRYTVNGVKKSMLLDGMTAYVIAIVYGKLPDELKTKLMALEWPIIADKCYKLISYKTTGE
jgi:hypothetical protein